MAVKIGTEMGTWFKWFWCNVVDTIWKRSILSFLWGYKDITAVTQGSLWENEASEENHQRRGILWSRWALDPVFLTHTWFSQLHRPVKSSYFKESLCWLVPKVRSTLASLKLSNKNYFYSLDCQNYEVSQYSVLARV